VSVVRARLRFGVSTPGGPEAADELDEVARLAGEQPTLVLWFSDFVQEPPLSEMEAVAARGATPLVTWEPWRWGGGRFQPAFALRSIAAGAHDGQLRLWAKALQRWGRPVLMRFAHEMNGDWYPWSERAAPNRSGDYVAAWRRVHDVFAASDAGNVAWVWAPNTPYEGSADIAGLYPGDSYVDVVGLDGYNWGTSQPWSTWTTPAALFGPGLAELRSVAPGKPIMITETASAEVGGSKATWIDSLFSYLTDQDDVSALVWFHQRKETYWRINSSPAAAAAFRQGFARTRAAGR
jgi:beta-mannanase